MHESIFELVVEPRGLSDDIEQLKTALRNRTTVYDMQFLSDFARDESNFFDGFHLDGPVKQTLADLLFTDIESDSIIRYEKD